MKKIWDVTITKIGAVEIMAETEKEVVEKLENMNISENIKWEDEWTAVDICAKSD